ncbi:uncharacterized protein LOC100904181 [Galendromus occidentalis]|uniref:Uncharacterized protein LOC100904181 n=1 Tax=Galendromus occidentalis TaxID=34638 RepID=A0AAJ6QT51_9ACAR|nr:uncharacterized protein LOC100904181 [Galendromus occidentalis]
MAFQPVLYKNDDLVRRKLNPEPRALRWTLRQECIEQVKLNLLLWARTEGRSEPPPYQLNVCPSTLLQEVLHSVLNDESSSEPLKRVAEQLLANDLEEFDFRCIDDLTYCEIGAIFELVKAHGVNFKRLRLVGSWIHHPEAPSMIRQIVKSCPNLEQCALQEAYHEDLVCVARHCAKLRQLEILHPSITCGDVAKVQALARREKFAMRKTLKRLSVPSSLSGSALLMLLEIFPEVDDVTCIDLEGLMQAMAESEPSAVARCAKIRSLRVNKVMGWNSMENLVLTFPRLQSISLITQEIMNLQQLSNLPHLTCLRLENSHVIPSSYTDDILPLLGAIGPNLKHLSLVHFDVIELPKTHSFCPNLVSLDLQHFTLLGCNSDPIHRLQYGREKPFAGLRFLTMRPRQGKFISQEACHMLLKHCRGLRSVELHEAYGMTDALASILSDHNGFSELQRIRLRGGHCLSRNGVETLLRRSTELRYCHIP